MLGIVTCECPMRAHEDFLGSILGLIRIPQQLPAQAEHASVMRLVERLKADFLIHSKLLDLGLRQYYDAWRHLLQAEDRVRDLVRRIRGPDEAQPRVDEHGGLRPLAAIASRCATKVSQPESRVP